MGAEALVIFGKVGFALARPSSLVVLLLALAVLAWPRPWARWLTAGLVVVLVVVTFGRLGDRALARLEAGWMDVSPPASVHGIVVLGGGSIWMPGPGEPLRTMKAGEGIERLLLRQALGLRYPDATWVFTGGGSGLGRGGQSEAWHARGFWEEMGVAEPLIVEDASLNTRDNAVNTRGVVGEVARTETWLLVTSAFHMRRALATFRAAGWSVVPYAVDFRTIDRPAWPGERLDVARQLARLDLAAREWLGFQVYRLRGWAE
ncbi:MAG: YdcF family protein [Pseudomonadota bacterium]